MQFLQHTRNFFFPDGFVLQAECHKYVLKIQAKVLTFRFPRRGYSVRFELIKLFSVAPLDPSREIRPIWLKAGAARGRDKEPRTVGEAFPKDPMLSTVTAASVSPLIFPDGL